MFQQDCIEAGTEAGNGKVYRDAERIIIVMCFRLSLVETRYSNSEREELAVVGCLTEVRWMVMASKYPILVYTDHEALRTLLTGIDNDARGGIVKWQARLGEYDIKLLHRSVKIHLGIADGLSRLPTRLLIQHVAEDTEGLRPVIGSLIPVSGLVYDVGMNAELALALRREEGFCQMSEVVDSDEEDTNQEELNKTGNAKEGEQLKKAHESFRAAVADMRWERWHRWLESSMYGAVVRVRLNELEKGVIDVREGDMGRSQRRALEREMPRYVLVDGNQPRPFFDEKNTDLASCVREGGLKRVDATLGEGHGHFAMSITLGQAHGTVFWPSRVKDIGRWIASCEPCQRVTKIQRSRRMRSILLFQPMDMIGMDYVGPISPPCQTNAYSYILVIIYYLSHFLWGIGVHKADQTSMIKALLKDVIPIVGWPLTV